MRPILFSFFAPVALGYHLFQYSGPECHGTAAGDYRLAGPSACQPLDYGTAQSVLVKIDNIHDDQYDVDFYNGDNCDGQIVRVLHNTNGCVDMFAMPGFTAKSVRVRKHVSSKRDDAAWAADADSLLNYQGRSGSVASNAAQKKTVTPLRQGVFVNYNASNVDSEGTYQDDVIHHFFPYTEEEAPEVQRIWATEYESQPESEFTVTKHTSPAPEPRNFILDKCFENALCASHALNIAITTNQVALAMYRVLGNTPWTHYRNEAFLYLGTVSSGITIYGQFTTSGTQDMSCDSENSTGALIRDLLERESTYTKNITNALFTICGNNSTCFRAALRLYADNDSETNQDGCGACVTCL